MPHETLKLVGAAAAAAAGITLLALLASGVTADESTDELVARLRAQRRPNPSGRRKRRPVARRSDFAY